MEVFAGIQARVAWELLFNMADGVIYDSGVDYGCMLDGMEATELLALMEMIQERLGLLGASKPALVETAIHRDLDSQREPRRLFVDKSYNIRPDSPTSPPLPFRPLLKALFILFLKHPEGVLLKERDRYAEELNDIYGAILPNSSEEDRRKRVNRLMDLTDNSFSENASKLNSEIDLLFPGLADYYKIKGSNGHPRRIMLDPLLVVWE